MLKWARIRRDLGGIRSTHPFESYGKGSDLVLQVIASTVPEAERQRDAGAQIVILVARAQQAAAIEVLAG